MVGHTNEGRLWLTVPEAAETAGVSRQAIHGWIARGHVEAFPSDDGQRIAAADLDRFLALRDAAQARGLRTDTILRWRWAQGMSGASTDGS